MAHPEKEYHELSFYTLAHQDPSFIHQHIVDAYAAQTANAYTKPITIIFALAGLYLYLEKNYTGREIQKFHMKMASNKTIWPAIPFPAGRGEITVSDVLDMPPGTLRDKAIREWCLSVWHAYKQCQKQIKDLVTHYLETA
jgi:hypothetical protein